MVALDARTGAVVPGFGENGVVDLKLDADQEMDLITGEVGLQSAPVIAGDIDHRRRIAPRRRRAEEPQQPEGLRARLRRQDR